MADYQTHPLSYDNLLRENARLREEVRTLRAQLATAKGLMREFVDMTEGPGPWLPWGTATERRK